MRLICPNCGAQYEVDEAVIPLDGRDVQCSSCAHIWFQRRASAPPAAPPPAAEPTPAGREAADAPPAAARGDDTQPAQDAGAGDDALWPDFRDLDDASRQDAAEPAGEAQDEVAQEAAQAAARRPLDEAVLGVLREEAEREAEARRTEAETIETQPDLGLRPESDAGDRESAARERVAMMRGLDPEEAEHAEAEAALAARPRRETLPDIEEINSSLEGRGTAQDEDGTGPDAPAASQRRGFRWGFLLMLLIVLLLMALYAYSTRIEAALPQFSGAIGAYTEAADALRLWLDGAARSASETIRGLSSSAEG